MRRPVEARDRPAAGAAVEKARAAVFLLVLAWIVGAPLYRQLLGGESRHARAWVMFSAIGLGVIDARFYEQRPDGTRRRLDRFAVLGIQRPAAPARRRLNGAKAVRRVARRLCRRLGGDADVRVVARRAVRQGWLVLDDGETNVCRTLLPPANAEQGLRSK